MLWFCLLSELHHNDAFTRIVNFYRPLMVKPTMAKRSSLDIMSQPWLPQHIDDDDIFAFDEKREELENNCIQFLATLIRHKLNSNNEEKKTQDLEHNQSEPTTATCLAHDRFRDLTCHYEGELVLENLFHTDSFSDMQVVEDEDTIRGAIIALQSLTILGMQVGVKGTPHQKERSVTHLKSNTEESNFKDVKQYFDGLSSKRLKHNVDITAGIQILAALQLKRNAQSAFDLLVRLGAWKKHEDLALLRSGFPTRFTEEEHKYAVEAIDNSHDPDEVLGLRKDLRHLKVYTIDSEHTEEVDDGLSIENLTKSDGSKRKRIWIHIADADRWGKKPII